MNQRLLTTHGTQVLKFARMIPNFGHFGELAQAMLTMLTSSAWRDYQDGLGTYHFLPGEFDYFLALQGVTTKDMGQLYLTPVWRQQLQASMDRSRTGEPEYRRPLAGIIKAHGHGAGPLTDHWERYGWSQTRNPLSIETGTLNKTGRPKKGDNVTLLASRGNTSAYVLARLRRDGKQKLLDRIAVGELSAHRAAILAGYRTARTPYDQLLQLWQKLTPDDRRRFRRYVTSSNGHG